MGQNRSLFLYFCSFLTMQDRYSTHLTVNDKSIDGMLGSQTRGSRMEGSDESNEIWRHPCCRSCLHGEKVSAPTLSNAFWSWNAFPPSSHLPPALIPLPHLFSIQIFFNSPSHSIFIFVKRKWKSKNRNFAQIILLTKANWIWKCIFDTLLSSTCYLFEFNPGAHVVNKFFVSSKIRFFEGGSPGAYFIKLYGSINYGFIVTAKLWP